MVSEETGSVSLTKNGKLHRDLNKDDFREMLTNELIAPNSGKTSFFIPLELEGEERWINGLTN